MLAKDFVIITRHAATAAWIIAKAGLPADVRVVTGNATEADVRGIVVYGNVPMHLAAAASVVVAVEFATPPRGTELDAAEMDAAGATMRAYRVSPQGSRAWPVWEGEVRPDGVVVDRSIRSVGVPASAIAHHGPSGFRDSND